MHKNRGLIRLLGARREIARENMGHAGSSGSITLDVLSKTWWKERVEAVNRIVEADLTATYEKGNKMNATPLEDLPACGEGKEWETFGESQAVEPGQISMEVIDKNGRGERIWTSDPLVPNQISVHSEVC